MKLKCILLGKHSNRTPMAYAAYRELFEHHIEFVADITKAELVVLGHPADLHGLALSLQDAIKNKPSLQILVISEEPLWDTTWNGDLTKLINQIETKHGTLPFAYLNHSTSNLYDFCYIPYFITTEDKYFVRYQLLFNRNNKLTSAQIRHNWATSAIRYRFMAQKRLEFIYDLHHSQLDIHGLCRYRTMIASEMMAEGAVVSGEGWGTTKRRQALPDWHLDKLAVLDKQCLMISALENTHIQQYITEKIFDAYGLLSMPIYFASDQHAIHKLVPAGSYLNLYNRSIDEAKELMLNFNPQSADIDVYRAAQSNLATTFSNSNVLHGERFRVAKRVLSYIQELL